MMRVALPHHLRTLAQVGKEIELTFNGPTTIGMVLDAVEAQYPMLQGTIRDHVTRQRRPFIRFFLCGQDWSHLPHETVLPEEVVTGIEPFRIVGAMAGG